MLLELHTEPLATASHELRISIVWAVDNGAKVINISLERRPDIIKINLPL